MKSFPIFILGLVVLLTACKKYPEDGKRSWRTAKHRIYSHPWRMKEISVDGGDSTRSPNFLPIAFMVIEFKEDNLNYYEAYASSSEYKELTISDTPFNVSNRNYWHFTDSKKQVFMVADAYSTYSTYSTYTTNNYYYGGSLIPYANHGGSTWEIRKLTATELILELKNGGHDLRLSFSN
ncbi:MAG: hypothetical protein ACXVP0_08825 [Bacteroidia bacterium]